MVRTMALGKIRIRAIVYDITRKNVVHIGAYILPTEIFHCMYIRSAVDSINGKEYINYRTCMWACIRNLNYVCAFCCCMESHV